MKLKHLPALQHHFGSRWLVRRAWYALESRIGGVRRRTPIREWDQGPALFLPGENKPAEAKGFYESRRARPLPFFFSSSDRHSYAPLLRGWDDEFRNPIIESDALTRGRLRFFQHHELECGFPPDWHSNAFTNGKSPATNHWSEIADFGYGDIKVIWEPSRFGFAYALVRAYWRTGNEAYPETFWRLIENWRENNPPQRGANWKCGQEATFRAMAWCFGLHGFWESPATTPQRVLQLAQMLGITAERIAANIEYAIGQANNHGISEAVGLWTIGTLFPEFSAAEAWRERGRALLESQGQDLIYDDGAFSQHSVNYHRLMLHDYVWCLRLAELHGKPFTDGLTERVARAGEFLFQIQDERTGAVPYYGQNDGALILPLNNCGYQDFRPVVEATHYLARRTRLFDDGPWSEDSLWLFGCKSLLAPIESKPRADFRADVGGYYTLRSAESFVFTRCAIFRHRPSQADMLHVDLWWRGQNIALDAGTFSYNAVEPWAYEFAGTAVHNTVTADAADQMERAGKFLWLPWVRGRLNRLLRTGGLAYLEGEHDGYWGLQSPVSHRRGIVQLDDSWLVLDRLWSESQHRYRMHWLLPDAPHQFDERSGSVAMQTPAGEYYVKIGAVDSNIECSLIRADPASGRGWRAPFYNHREPALSLAVERNASSTTFWTLFSPHRCQVEWHEKSVRFSTSTGMAEVEIMEAPDAPLVRQVRAGERELNVQQ